MDKDFYSLTEENFENYIIPLIQDKDKISNIVQQFIIEGN